MRVRTAILFASLSLSSSWVAAAVELFRHADGDIHFSRDDGNEDPPGLWSSGETMVARTTATGRNTGSGMADGEGGAAGLSTLRPTDVRKPAPTVDCGASGAVCSRDIKPLSQGIEATVAGPALVSEVSISGGGTVSEGSDAMFTLTRTGQTTDALTVDVEVTESGAILTGDLPTSVAFAANADSATLAVSTKDDDVVDASSTVTATIASRADYTVAPGGGSAEVTVEENDAATFEVSVDPVDISESGAATITVTIANGVTFANVQGIALDFGGTATMRDGFVVSAGTL
ncbi:MAG: hypothetical protein OXE40_16765, partial [Gammaproteobacteria bacterium]|nr:hypothetical protein [Gammaproteobacteria bacterium]